MVRLLQECLKDVVEVFPSLSDEADIINALNQQGAQTVAQYQQVFDRLFVRPDHTLTVCRCFRPHLLQLLSALLGRSGSESTACGDVSGQLRLLIALAKAVALFPHVARLAATWLLHAAPPEALLQHAELVSQELLQAAAHAVLVLLLNVPEAARCWPPSQLLQLLTHQAVHLRWVGVVAAVHLLGLQDAQRDALTRKVLNEGEEELCAAAWRQLWQQVAEERALMWVPDAAAVGFAGQGASAQQCEGQADTAAAAAAAAAVQAGDCTVVAGIPLPSRGWQLPQQPQQPQQQLALTVTVRSNLQATALALSQGLPVLLEGPPGCGKSAVLQRLAQDTGNTDMLVVHADDQMDAKSLFGAYICTSVPGQFQWQPGPLTTAVTSGRWLVMENVNQAPAEVLAALLPVLESHRLYNPQRGEVLEAAPGFQLVATVTLPPSPAWIGTYGSPSTLKEVMGSTWGRVVFQQPATAEQLAILASRYPRTCLLLPGALASVAAIAAACGQPSASSALSLPCEAPKGYDAVVAQALAAAGMRRGEAALQLGRFLSLHDLVKWCHRMQALRGAALEVSNAKKTKPSKTMGEEGPEAAAMRQVLRCSVAARGAAFEEAADCFLASVAEGPAQAKLLTVLAAVWGLPAQMFVEEYQRLKKPVLQVKAEGVAIGRAFLPFAAGRRDGAAQQLAAAAPQPGSVCAAAHRTASEPPPFSRTAHSLRIMERVAAALQLQEAVLLLGETGTGKTTMIQEIASLVGAKLVVINLSHQTDSSDLLGGFRPLEVKDGLRPLVQELEALVRATWPKGNNDAVVSHVHSLLRKRKWPQLMAACRKTLSAAAPLLAEPDAAAGREQPTAKRRRKVKLAADLQARWRALAEEVADAERMAQAAEGGFAFAYVEGMLVRAVREGWWLLLDEINLAPAEALERLAGLLDQHYRHLLLSEKGEGALQPHAAFRLLAAMNPATDAGKRHLAANLRSRFTELWVGEPPMRGDLEAIVSSYLAAAWPAPPVVPIVDFYLDAKAKAATSLQDGAGQVPSFNLRTLCHALEYTRTALPLYGRERALYDGFAMCFQTLLNADSSVAMEALLRKHLLHSSLTSKQLLQTPTAPPAGPGTSYVKVEQFWLEKGPLPALEEGSPDGSGMPFVLTPTVRGHLRMLARAALLRRYPILLQGPTSSGKTSLVAYLSARTGHHFVRINNHEQTDLQEYLGSYVADDSGRLRFREGALVQAVRQGHWVVLDELNLAPSEVLEALNRLLDDNRELFVPELQETVKPHPHFQLFATQNPPGIYAGRKVLSRAFRTRFLELHVGDLPHSELVTILNQRCRVAPSHAGRMVEAMAQLHRRRRSSNVFAGKHGFITPRDLFRWGDRLSRMPETGADAAQLLARHGFSLLGERLRSADEREEVKAVLQACTLPRSCGLDEQASYRDAFRQPMQELAAAIDRTALLPSEEAAALQRSLGAVVWTQGMKRLYCLADACLDNKEPALLVGETGTGKTTVCQMLAFIRRQRLHVLNCNLHTEVSDILGGFRPIRNRSGAAAALRAALQRLLDHPQLPALCAGHGHGLPPLQRPELLQDMQGEAMASCQTAVRAILRRAQAQQASATAAEPSPQLAELVEACRSLERAARVACAPFEWVDGPLVQAMRNGDIILIDEINLAEDAVLERLNSVLEPGRTVLLAEKGGEGAEVVKAHESFRIVATMNPGGDYGKKELSPALSNRFTQIWVPSFQDRADLETIVKSRLAGDALRECVTSRLLQFWSFYRELPGVVASSLSLRTLLTWVSFINAQAGRLQPLPAYVHGAFLVLLDGPGLGSGLPAAAGQRIRTACEKLLAEQLPAELQPELAIAAGNLQEQPGHPVGEDPEEPGRWGIPPFYVPKGCAAHGPKAAEGDRFEFSSRTTARNAFRVLRALQLRQAVLLEGNPGVGKTTLIAALARACCHRLIRINLSEQTDMMDLLGSDLPVEGGMPGEFAWCDGPLLQAIKGGHWVLLDELNLAGQSILEGLNAVLDHRAEVYIPELGQSFRCPPSFRLFAAQNPLGQGGGRKGLPKSFLNRFTSVYVEMLQASDLVFIASALHPRYPQHLLHRMVAFLEALHTGCNLERTFGARGGPWEFNLRDLLRWCHLAVQLAPDVPEGADATPSAMEVDAEADGEGAAAGAQGHREALERCVQTGAQVLFLQRMRTAADRAAVADAFLRVWGAPLPACERPSISVGLQHLGVGSALLRRAAAAAAVPAPRPGSWRADFGISAAAPQMESLALCLQHSWMALLVGPAQSGKTGLVRSLARAAGRQLVEIPLTSGTDTSDLLGGFEQLEPRRRLQDLQRRCHALAVQLASALLLHGGCSTAADHAALEAAQQLLAEVQAAGKAAEDGGDFEAQLQGLRRLLDSAGAAVQQRSLLASSPGLEQLAALSAEADALEAAQPSSAAGRAAGRFEWTDGALTRCIQDGGWVLLDNANLCNPTVLDRLNPLLEPGGVLYLNECGLRDGQPRIVRPHPDFRLVLAMDPAHGELSQAMRNRGVEICVLPGDVFPAAPPPPAPPLPPAPLLPAAHRASAALQQASAEADATAAQLHSAGLLAEAGRVRTAVQGSCALAGMAAAQLSPLVQLLVQAGVAGWQLPQAMAAAHSAAARMLADRAGAAQEQPGARHLRVWGSLVVWLLALGWPLADCLSASWQHVYVAPLRYSHADLEAALAELLPEHLAAWQLEAAEPQPQPASALLPPPLAVQLGPLPWEVPLPEVAWHSQAWAAMHASGPAGALLSVLLLLAPAAAPPRGLLRLALGCMSTRDAEAGSGQKSAMDAWRESLLQSFSKLDRHPRPAHGAAMLSAGCDAAHLPDGSDAASLPLAQLLLLLLHRLCTAALCSCLPAHDAAAAAQQLRNLAQAAAGSHSAAALEWHSAAAAELRVELVRLIQPPKPLLLQGLPMDLELAADAADLHLRAFGLKNSQHHAPTAPAAAGTDWGLRLSASCSVPIAVPASCAGAPAAAALAAQMAAREWYAAALDAALQQARQKRAQLQAETAVQAGAASAYQASFWKYSHPRQHFPLSASCAAPAKPAVAALHPALRAAAEMEGAALAAARQPGGPVSWSALARFQWWRHALWLVVHPPDGAAQQAGLVLIRSAPGAELPAPDHERGLHLLARTWARMAAACDALLPAGGLQDTDVWPRWQSARVLLDSALEQAEPLQLDSLEASLWNAAGRPLAPPSLQQHEDALTALRLCGYLRIGCRGFDINPRDRLACLQRDGAGSTDELDRREGRSLQEEQQADAGAGLDALQGMAAAVSVDVDLRRSLLQAAALLDLPHQLLPDAAGSKKQRTGVVSLMEAELSSRLVQAHEQATAAPALHSLSTEGDAPGAACKAAPRPAAAVDPALVCFPAAALARSRCVRLLQLQLLPLLELDSLLADAQVVWQSARLLLRLQEQAGPSGGSLGEGALSAAPVADCATELVQQLQSSVFQILRGGCRSLADAVGQQQLLWLLDQLLKEASPQPPDLLLRLLPSLQHSISFRWQAAMWDGALSTRNILLGEEDSTAQSEEKAQPGDKLWTLTEGPARLHQAVVLPLTAALTRRGGTPLHSLPLKLEQLTLALRSHISLFCYRRTSRPATTRAALLSQLCNILLAHLPQLPPHVQAPALAAVQKLLAAAEPAGAELSSRAPDDHLEPCMSAVQQLFAQAAAAPFQRAWQAQLRPALQSLQASLPEEQRDAAALEQEGCSWVHLGLARLCLLAPLPRHDPAMEPAVQQQLLLSSVESQLAPSVAARAILHMLPVGRSQSVALQAAVQRLEDAGAAVRQLAQECVGRPAPAQYQPLRAEVQRFLDGVARPSAVEQLVSDLLAHQHGAEHKARSWQATAGAWCDALQKRFPLYRDIHQPLQLAVLEVRHGLNLLASAPLLHRHPSLTRAVAGCLQFPRASPLDAHLVPPARSRRTPPAMLLQDGLPAAIQAAMKDTADAHSAASGSSERRSGSDVATFSLRVRSLHASALALKSWVLQHPATVPAAATEAMHTLFAAALAIWQTLREQEAERLEEEQSLFRSKACSTDILAEEAQEDADYRRHFPDHSLAFSDLMMGDGADGLTASEGGNGEAHQKARDGMDEVAEGAAESAAARSLEEGPFLQSLIDVHRLLVTRLAGSAASSSHDSPAAAGLAREAVAEEWEQCCRLADELLDIKGHCLPASADALAAGGLLLRICTLHDRLNRAPSRLAAPAAPKAPSASIDVQQPCVPEAVLLVQPVFAVLRRIQQLLQDWPEQPLLEQLAAICERALGLPADAPLKKVMVGLELLLDRSRIWEEHCASSATSLQLQLSECGKLAARWRSLELSSWACLLQNVMKRQAAGANRLWFHILQLLMSTVEPPANAAAGAGAGTGQSSMEEAAQTLEQVMQTATLGEYEARLQLVGSFASHMQLLGQQSSGGDAVVQRRAQLLGNVLGNLHGYYKQFLPVVADAQESQLGLLRKELADVVKLEKWEDRGYYHFHTRSQKAQRQLLRLRRRAEAALQSPATPAITSVLMASPLASPSAPALPAKAVPAAPPRQPQPGNPAAALPGVTQVLREGLTIRTPARKSGKHRKGDDAGGGGARDGGEASVVGKVGDADAEAEDEEGESWQQQYWRAREGCIRGWERVCQVVDDGDAAAAPPQVTRELAELLEPTDRQQWRGRLRQLAPRMAAVLKKAACLPTESQLVQQLRGSSLAADELAGEAAARSVGLRNDTARGCRARKKKALVDFLSALGDLGLSKQRSGVPPDQRTMQSWFLHPGLPDWAPGRCASGSEVRASAAAPKVAELSAEAGTTVSRWYFACLARIRALWEAAKQPAPDISAAEQQAGQRYCEHLLHVLREQRNAITQGQQLQAQLQELVALLSTLQAGPPQPQQHAGGPGWLSQRGHSRAWLQLCSLRLDRLVAAVCDALLLCEAIARVDPRGPFSRMQAAAQQQLACLRDQAVLHQRQLALHAAHCSPSNQPHGDAAVALVPPAAQAAAAAAASWALQAADALTHLHWPGVREVRSSALAVVAAADDCCGSTPAGTGGGRLLSFRENASALCEHLEAGVRFLLRWAQRDSHRSTGRPEGEGDAAAAPAPALLQALQEARWQLAGPALQSACSRLAASVGLLVAAAQQQSDSAGCEELPALQRMLLGVKPLLVQAAAAHEILLCDAMAWHRSTCKLAYISISILTSLTQEGFCAPAGKEGEGEGEDDGEGDGDGEFKEGTGIGEGQGAKDVSDQIQHEDQIVGAEQQGEQKAEPEEQEAAEEGVQGIEMEQDFDADMVDIPPDERADEQDGDEETEQDALQQQMGDTGDQGEDVDGRLWNEEDDKQVEEQGAPKDAGYDDQNTLQVADKSELDYVQGQPEAGTADDNGDEGKDAPPPEKQESRREAAPKPAVEPEAGEEAGEDEEELPDAAGEGEEEAGEGQDAAGPGASVVPEGQPEELELPEDLNLDGGEEAEEEPAEGARQEEEEGEEEGGAAAGAAAEQEAGASGREPEAPELEEVEEAAAGEDGEESKPDEEESAPEAADQEEGGDGVAGVVAQEDEAAEREDAGQEARGEGTDAGQQAEAGEPAEARPQAGPRGSRGAAAAADAMDTADAAAPAAAPAPADPQGGGGAVEAAAQPAERSLAEEDQLQPEAGGLSGSSRQQDGTPQLGGEEQHQEREEARLTEANPLRSLADALDRWRKNLSVLQPPDGSPPREEEAVGGGDDGQPEEEHGGGGEWEFVTEGGESAADAQVLADATQEQVAEQQALLQDAAADQVPESMEVDDSSDAAAGGTERQAEAAASSGQQDGREDASGSATRRQQPASARSGAPRRDGSPQQPQQLEEGGGGKEGFEEEAGPEWMDVETLDAEAAQRRSTAADGAAVGEAMRWGAQPAEDGAEEDERERAAEVEELRQKLQEQLQTGSAGGGAEGDGDVERRGRALWSRTESLTAGLAGELAEQLRLVLEPTLASKLSGEYRSGKRLNMRRVIAYIASHFRKDKIWLRRARPDKRQYQVVLAMDSSRSMQEQGCSGFALEALALLSRALMRLEIGQLGVVAFGGPEVSVLHPLDQPFTEAAAAAVMGRLRFDADNTIRDTPMLQLMNSLHELLDLARHSSGGAGGASASSGAAQLHQLVLVVADGRFHEKGAVQAAIRRVSSMGGVMMAMIVLDNPQQSILSMEKVEFGPGGKPALTKYIDSFPFPYYLLLQDLAQLPLMLAQLLRQFFQLVAS